MLLRPLVTAGLVLLLMVSCSPAPAGPSPAESSAEAVAAYQSWVQGQWASMVEKQQDLQEALRKEDVPKALAILQSERVLWERLGPAWNRDPGHPSLEATWARLEDRLLAGDPEVGLADSLALELQGLQNKGPAEMTADQMIHDAVSLAEAAVSLTEFRLETVQGRIEGAEQIWQLLSSPVRTSDPELAKTLDARFSLVYGLLDVQRKNGTFRPSKQVYPKEVLALSVATRDLAASLDRLRPAVSTP